LFPFFGGERSVKPAESNVPLASNSAKGPLFATARWSVRKRKNAAQMPRFSFFLEIEKIETKK
jgi:hypothetical protein